MFRYSEVLNRFTSVKNELLTLIGSSSTSNVTTKPLSLVDARDLINDVNSDYLYDFDSEQFFGSAPVTFDLTTALKFPGYTSYGTPIFIFNNLTLHSQHTMNLVAPYNIILVKNNIQIDGIITGIGVVNRYWSWAIKISDDLFSNSILYYNKVDYNSGLPNFSIERGFGGTGGGSGGTRSNSNDNYGGDGGNMGLAQGGNGQIDTTTTSTDGQNALDVITVSEIETLVTNPDFPMIWVGAGAPAGKQVYSNNYPTDVALYYRAYGNMQPGLGVAQGTPSSAITTQRTGRGGATLVLIASSVTLTGQIHLDGEDGADGMPGDSTNGGSSYAKFGGAGGGGGGVFLVYADTIANTATISVSGGTGGAAAPDVATYPIKGPGGDGGDGVVLLIEY